MTTLTENYNELRGIFDSGSISPDQYVVKDPKILVVEDDEGFLEMVKKSMAKWWPECVLECVDTVKAGFQAMKNKDYTLAMIDVRLKGESGIRLLKRIRKEQKKKCITCIMTGGNVDRALEDQVEVAGGLWVQRKPRCQDGIDEMMIRLKTDLGLLVGQRAV